MPNIVIATPAYGEIFYTPYVQSVIKLIRLFHQKGWEFSFRSISYSEISESRNYLLTHWIDKSNASHILFLDADMGFEPHLIAEMVELDQPVVGVVYPKRNIDLLRVATAAADGGSPEQAVAKSQQYVFRPLRGERQLRDGFLKVEGCGAGILLIQRSCVKKMLELIPNLSDATAKKTSPLAKELDRLIRVFDILHVGGSRLSEDYSFCHRWKNLCGGEIWACVSHEIVHIGLHQFKGRYANVLPVRPGQTVTGRIGVTARTRPKDPEKK